MIPIANIKRILWRVSTEDLIGSRLLRADGVSIKISAIEIDQQNGETYLIGNRDGKAVRLGMSVFSSANFVGIEVNSPELKEALMLDLEGQVKQFEALEQRWESASKSLLNLEGQVKHFATLTQRWENASNLYELTNRWSAAISRAKSKLDGLESSDFFFKALQKSEVRLSDLERRFKKFFEIAKLIERMSESFSKDNLWSDASYFVKLEVEKSGLDFVLHATPIANLESILKFGLVTRVDARSSVLDEERWDGRMDHISFSINNISPYLYRKFSLPLQLKQSVCILRINKKILWQRESKFLFSNAARKALSYSGASDKEFHTASAYREMWFGESENSQGSAGLKSYPQSPFDRQAEVQIPGNIGLEYFDAVCLHQAASEKTLKDVKSLVMKYAPHIDTFIMRNNSCFDTRD